jgi:GT2 family glycosyltransferase
MKVTVDVSIIIVNYNTKELTLSCLLSLKKAYTNRVTWEIFVVDNASTDGSVEALKQLQKQDPFFRNLRVVSQSENTGFARGNNSAINMSSGRYVLLLNSDTVVLPGAIQEMIEFMDAHKKAGASTCKLILPNGSIDPACHRGFPSPWAALTYFLGLERLFGKSNVFGQYHLGYKDMTTAHEIDVPSGAFFLVRREILRVVGGLDEDYFMYGEDIDWAYRIKKHGWEIWFNPRVMVTHLKKQSGRAHSDLRLRKSIERHFYETMILFYQKHYRKTYPAVITFFIILLLRFRIMLLNIFSI